MSTFLEINTDMVVSKIRHKLHGKRKFTKTRSVNIAVKENLFFIFFMARDVKQTTDTVQGTRTCSESLLCDLGFRPGQGFSSVYKMTSQTSN